MRDFKNRLSIAYVGLDRALLPTVKVVWEYPIGNGKNAAFTQKIHRTNDISKANAKAQSLLRSGTVDEVRKL